MGVAPTDPGIPDRASTPIQPLATARATNGSHGSPAATRTSAPPQASTSAATPLVRTATTRPSKPSSATSRFEPPPSTSTGTLRRSASATAETSVASSWASTNSLAGPPTRSVVCAASSSATAFLARLETRLEEARLDEEGGLRHAEHLLLPARHRHRHRDQPPRRVGLHRAHGAGDHDLGTAVVVGDHDRAGELRAELADAARGTGPAVHRAGGEGEGVHPVGDHAREPDRAGDPVRPVDRVAVAARARVAHQVGAGHAEGPDGQLGALGPGGHCSPSSSPALCTSTALAVQTSEPSESRTALLVPMMSAPPIWRSESTVSSAVRRSPTRTGRS